MSLHFNHIAVIGTHTQTSVAETVQAVIDLLSPLATVYVETLTAQSLARKPSQSYSIEALAQQCEVVIVVGGDGNFLNAARSISQIRLIPIIGINRGRLGFLTDVMPQSLEQELLPILQGHYRSEMRAMIQAKVLGDNGNKEMALNEVVVSAGENIHLFEMRVFIDGRYAFDQRADGLIIATPTGSTAHSLSAGGPIMYPSVDAVVLVPMFSHTLNARPIVIDAKSHIEILIAEYNHPNPVVSLDGRTLFRLKSGDRLSLCKSQHQVQILHPLEHDYFHSLRAKLHWGKMLFE